MKLLKNKKGLKTLFSKRIILLLVVLILISGCKEQIVGGDKDEHGCIGSAGYQWCEVTQKCQRLWEIPCETDACEEDSDCVVKNIGNCCGYYPGCVNVNYIPDLEAIQKECDEKGIFSTCGFEEIKECACINNQCVEG